MKRISYNLISSLSERWECLTARLGTPEARLFLGFKCRIAGIYLRERDLSDLQHLSPFDPCRDDHFLLTVTTGWDRGTILSSERITAGKGGVISLPP